MEPIFVGLLDSTRTLDRDVKPVVLACLGDIALAIQGEFRQYLEVCHHRASLDTLIYMY